VRPGSHVLDLACGAGRHARLFLERGCRVLAVDRDVSALRDLRNDPHLEVLEIDLERGSDYPLAGRLFDAVVVVNYLHRPQLANLVSSVAPGGLLLYETFAAGNERFGRPRNPDFLLKPGELLDAVRGRLRVLAYEDLDICEPSPAAVQRIAAHRIAAHRIAAGREDPRGSAGEKRDPKARSRPTRPKSEKS
jgi:SAM-dependent methyltransferase